MLRGAIYRCDQCLFALNSNKVFFCKVYIPQMSKSTNFGVNSVRCALYSYIPYCSANTRFSQYSRSTNVVFKMYKLHLRQWFLKFFGLLIICIDVLNLYFPKHYLSSEINAIFFVFGRIRGHLMNSSTTLLSWKLENFRTDFLSKYFKTSMILLRYSREGKKSRIDHEVQYRYIKLRSLKLQSPIGISCSTITVILRTSQYRYVSFSRFFVYRIVCLI